jgi:hypothetical protein
MGRPALNFKSNSANAGGATPESPNYYPFPPGHNLEQVLYLLH